MYIDEDLAMKFSYRMMGCRSGWVDWVQRIFFVSQGVEDCQVLSGETPGSSFNTSGHLKIIGAPPPGHPSSIQDQPWIHMDQYLLIPFFSGMNIHLPAILMFTRGTRFWHTAMWIRSQALVSFKWIAAREVVASFDSQPCQWPETGRSSPTECWQP